MPDEHVQPQPLKDTEHHIWCHFAHRPREGCAMCEGLWARYPYDAPEEAFGLMERHFPQTIRRA